MNNPVTKGQSTTPDNPGTSQIMAWIAEHRDYDRDYCLIWPFGRTNSGYAGYIRLGKWSYVHRYMCEYRNGTAPADRPQAAHSCGRGRDGCVNPRHLSWKSNSENQVDRFNHGTNKQYTLTEDDVVAILDSDLLPHQAAKLYGVAEGTIRQIRAGQTWNRKRYRVPTAEEKAAILAEIDQPPKYLMEKFNLKKGYVYRLKRIHPPLQTEAKP